MKYPIPFGRHLLLERVNVGGMAEVFKAKSFGVEGFERIVAVKRILPTMAEDQEFVTMFVDEARIASHLTHQNIVQIYELGRHDDTYFISMEYVSGRDLRQILDLHKRQKKPMDVAKACFIASRVCEALEYAHVKKDPAGKDLKIIHRDVSPQNVIISFEGEVKLCDFGIAKAASRMSRTQVGVLKGKFAYMSPEQVRGQPTDRRSDLFALGVIFYEMLTGERLFLGESDYSTLDAVRAARVPPPTQFNAKIPPQLEKLMYKLLAREPKDRYQWASEAHEDLLDHLVQDGKIYHSRNLRSWMQEVYAREIEIENAKLEEFMKLRHPRLRGDTRDAVSPAPTVSALADGRTPLERDPSIETHVDTSAEKELAGLAAPVDTGGKLRAFHEDTNTDAGARRSDATGREQRAQQGTSPVPDVPSAQSPVSNLFGAPVLAERSTEGEDAVRMVVRTSDPIESNPTQAIDPAKVSLGAVSVQEPIEPAPENDFERTQFDTIGERNDTLFEGAEMTDEESGRVSGAEKIGAEIQAVQSSLIDRLAQAGLDGETIDGRDKSDETISPFVPDPSEGARASGAPAAVVTQLSLVEKTALEPQPDLTPADQILLAPSRLERDGSERGPVPEDFDAEDEGTIEGTLELGSNAPLLGEDGARLADGRSRPGRPSGLVDEARRPERRANGETQIAPQGVRAASRRRIWEIRPEEPHGAGTPAEARAASPAEARAAGEGRSTPRAITPTPRPPPVEAPLATRTSWASAGAALLREGGERSLGALRDPRVMVGTATIVLLLTISVMLFFMFRTEGASLRITTEPVQRVEVLIDGQLIGHETPLEATALGLGTHKIELRAKGYQTYMQVIQIAEAKPHTMVVPLEAIDPRTAETEAPPGTP